MKRGLQNCRPLFFESKRMKVKNYEFQNVRYTGEYGQIKLIFVQSYWVVQENAYVLTFAYEQSNYEKFQEIEEKIMDSFVVSS